MKTRKIYLTKEQKLKLKLDDYSKQVITGMLLSDAWMNKRGDLCRLCIQQKQESFVYSLWALFNELGIVGKIPFKRVQTPTRSSLAWKEDNKTYESYSFQTFTLPLFNEIFETWYIPVNGKNIKIIPINIRELLTDVAFTYWIAGDGSYDIKHKTIMLYTNSFTKEEVLLLIDTLKINFDIESSLRIIKRNIIEHMIYIPKKEVTKVIYLTQHLMPKEFLYKLGLKSS